MARPRSRSRRPLSALLLATLGACGSVTEHRVPATIASPRRTLDVEFWATDRSESTWVYLLTFDTLLFPVDAVASLWWSLEALANDERRVQWGPLGALGAILLPCTSTRFDLQPEDRNDRDYDNRSPGVRRVILPVEEAWLAGYERGTTSLQELTARGLQGASLDASVRRWSGTRRLEEEVRSGAVQVTATSPLRERFSR